MRERDDLRVAAYFPEDFDAIEPVVSIEMDFRHHVNPDIARTIFLGSKPVMVAGILQMWSGVGTAFIALDKEWVPQNAKWVVRTVRDLLREAFEHYGFHRIQADVRKDEPKALKFARACGFQSEGDMKAYGMDGSDYERFAIVKER